MKPTFSLVIQGPLISVGRTGKTADIGAAAASDNDIVSFSCAENICKIAEDFGKFFDQIVVSTWWGSDDEFTHPGVILARFDENSIPRVCDRSFPNKWVARNNVLKQFFGTYFGILALPKRTDYILKIRTDQYLDLQVIVDWLITEDVGDRIAVPYRMRSAAFLPDFYFAGKFEVMKSYFACLSQSGKANRYLITDSPHTDSVLKYAFERYANDIGLPLEAYLVEGTVEYKSIFVYMINFIFLPMPFTIYRGLRWRGEPLSVEHISYTQRASTLGPVIHLNWPEEGGRSLLGRLIKLIRSRFMARFYGDK